LYYLRSTYYRFANDGSLCYIHLHTRILLYADGFVIIECEEPGTGHATGQVILDYLTDTVVNKKASVKGSPLVSPDSRVVVSIDKAADGVTLVVQQVLGRCYLCIPGIHNMIL